MSLFYLFANYQIDRISFMGTDSLDCAYQVAGFRYAVAAFRDSGNELDFFMVGKCIGGHDCG